MTMRKSLAVLLAVVVLLVGCLSLPAFAAPDVRSMVLNRDAISLQVGETFVLRVQIAPFTADKSVVWVSSDESVASVKDGVVTGLSIGKAKHYPGGRNHHPAQGRVLGADRLRPSGRCNDAAPRLVHFRPEGRRRG